MDNTSIDRVKKLAGFYHTKKRMPTYEEMLRLFNYKSKAAAHYFINKLVYEGYLKKDGKGRLIPKNLGEIKVLGLVEAGFPTSAVEEHMDTMSLDEFLVEKKEATYLLKVKGESMLDAGILPGDLVLVERGREPKSGDIVIAEVDGEFTMKYFKKKMGKVVLVAANSKFKDIYPKEELKIVAVVRSVIRKY